MTDDEFLKLLERLSGALVESARHMESDLGRHAVYGVTEALDDATYRIRRGIWLHEDCLGLGCEGCDWSGNVQATD